MKSIHLQLEDKEFKKMLYARDIHPAKSWEKFIIAIVAEWYEAEKVRA